MTAAVAVNTLLRLWRDRDRLWRDDLRDEDRAFAWRIVIFLIFPILTLVDLRSTLVVCQWLGGFVKSWSYGLFWYHAEPCGLSSGGALIAVLFAGAFVQGALALSLVPSLLFRPHPFLATIIGYTVVFILGVNLVGDPLLSLTGLGGSRWELFLAAASPSQRVCVFGVYGLSSLLYLLAVSNQRLRLWFAMLARPLAAEDLRGALIQWRSDPDNPYLACRLGIAYERAGLRRQAKSRLKKLQTAIPRSIYTSFLEAVLSYRRRDYKRARQAFLITSDYPYVDGALKASLLAAAGCAAFAEADLQGALNLSERALEFDDASLVARMVKVDVFLRMGKKEQAGDEILCAIRRGLDLDIEDKIPLDTERTLLKISRLQAAERKSLHALSRL